MDKNTHVYCTNCVYGDILFNAIIFDTEIPYCCQNCYPWNPEDSVRLEKRPNYKTKVYQKK